MIIKISITKTFLALILFNIVSIWVVSSPNQKVGVAKRSRQFPFSLHHNQGLTLNRGSFVVFA
jgi:hypothetical protein